MSQYILSSYLFCSLLLEVGHSYDTYTTISRFDRFYHLYGEGHASTSLSLYTLLFPYLYSFCPRVQSQMQFRLAHIPNHNCRHLLLFDVYTLDFSDLFYD